MVDGKIVGIDTARDHSMKATQPLDCQMLTMAVWEGIDITSLKTVATSIRQLPLVLRVRVDWDNREIEILHQSPTTELMKESILRCCWRAILGRLENQ